MTTQTLISITPSDLQTLIIDSVKSALQTHKSNQTEPVVTWFNLTELCEYLPDKPAKQTMYGKISRNEFPHYKDGKKLRFLKSEVDEYLMRGKRFTQSDIDSHVDKLISNK